MLNRMLHRTAACLLAALAVVWTAGCPRYAYLANRITPLAKMPAEMNDLTSRSELVFLAIGDPGTGDRHQVAVAEGMRQACQAAPAGHCDFALVLGDNIYENGVDSVHDPSFRNRFESVYAPLGRVDFWVVPGNHDWHKRTSVQAQVDYSLLSRQWRMLSNHYAVPKLPAWIALYGLDTTVVQDLGESPDPARVEPLAESRKQQFEAAARLLKEQAGWRLLFGHHPVYSGGQHGYEHGNQGVLPPIRDQVEKDVIRANRVAVYFSGHDHHQELLQVGAAGYYQVVQGAAGRLRPVKRRQADPVTQKFACSEYGFTLVHSKPESMTLAYYGCGVDGRSGPCREIYAARLARAGDGSVGLEELPPPPNGCRAPAE